MNFLFENGNFLAVNEGVMVVCVDIFIKGTGIGSWGSDDVNGWGGALDDDIVEVDIGSIIFWDGSSSSSGSDVGVDLEVISSCHFVQYDCSWISCNLERICCCIDVYVSSYLSVHSQHVNSLWNVVHSWCCCLFSCQFVWNYIVNMTPTSDQKIVVSRCWHSCCIPS